MSPEKDNIINPVALASLAIAVIFVLILNFMTLMDLL